MLIQTVGQMRWLGLTLVWSILFLCGFFAFGATMPAVMAAEIETATDTPTIAFGAATYTMNEGDGSGIVTLLITPTTPTPVSVTVSSANIDGEADKDYMGLRQALAIAPGVSSVTLTVALLDDALVEGDEQLRLTLGNLQGAVMGTITETTVIIEDNDAVYLGVSDVTVDEEAKSVSLVITQSVASTLESVVDFRTIDGSATSPEDYAALSGSAIIPPGSMQATVTIQLAPDETPEPTESFLFQLENPLNAELANRTVTVTIIDDDFFPQLQVAPAAASEADGILSFVVSLSSSWPQAVTVEYTTVDGTATAPDDYLMETGVLIIPPGNLTAMVLVSLAHDQEDEPDETLFLRLTNPVQAILAATQVEGVIHDSPPNSPPESPRDTPHRSREVLFLPGLKR